jgi:hypothetical protein
MTVNASWGARSKSRLRPGERRREREHEVRPMLHIDIPTLEFKALAATTSDACVLIYVPTSPLAENAQVQPHRIRGSPERG